MPKPFLLPMDDAVWTSQQGSWPVHTSSARTTSRTSRRCGDSNLHATSSGRTSGSGGGSLLHVFSDSSLTQRQRSGAMGTQIIHPARAPLSARAPVSIGNSCYARDSSRGSIGQLGYTRSNGSVRPGPMSRERSRLGRFATSPRMTMEQMLCQVSQQLQDETAAEVSKTAATGRTQRSATRDSPQSVPSVPQEDGTESCWSLEVHTGTRYNQKRGRRS